MLSNIRPVKSLMKLLFSKAFVYPQDYMLYYRLRIQSKNLDAGSPIYLHPRVLNGHAILCRPGTSDISVLNDFLLYNFYLPSYSLEIPQIIVDLGANVGYTTLHFAYLFPSARIIGVEMDKGNYDILKANIRGLEDRISVINVAIWHENGIVTYQGNHEDAYQVTNKVPFTPESFQSVISMTMDQLIVQNSFDRIDYLKMDIEGAEKDILLTHSPDWLSFVEQINIEYHDDTYCDPILKVLEEYGFSCAKDTKHWAAIKAIRSQSLSI